MADNTTTQQPMAPTSVKPSVDDGQSFDAASFFEAKGMSFHGLDDTGMARVTSANGEDGIFDVQKFVTSKGMDPSKVDVTFNNVDTAINESPVGLLDRLKLSLGNKKGSVDYLRKSYQDATADAQGNLVVKDKGVWKRVDMDGISNDDGWKASEILGDVADLAGDVIVGAGGLAGGVAGGGLASVGTAAIGSGVASGAKAAMGRLVGTYDATPEEVIRDIALDTLLGGAGEGIAMGAKHLVGPALKSGFRKITGFGEAFQDNAAKLLSAVDGQNGPDIYRTAISNGDTVIPMVESYAKEAAEQATNRGAQAVTSGLPQSQSILMREIAENAAANSARPMVENVQGGLNKFFGDTVDGLIKTHIPNEAEAAKSLKAVSTSLGNTLEQFFAKSGLGVQVSEGGVSTYKALKAKEMQAFLTKMGSPVEMNVAAKLTKRLTDVRAFTDGISKGVSPKNFKGVLRLTQELDNILGDIPTGARQSIEDAMQALGFDVGKSIDTALTAKGVLPKGFQEGYSALRGAYREKKAIVNSVVGSLQKNGSNETYKSVGHKMLDLHRAASRGDGQAAQALKTLADLTEDGSKVLNNFANRSAAAAMTNFRSASALAPNAGIVGNVANMSARAALPASLMIGKMQRRAGLKSFLNSPKYKLFAEGAKTLKAGGQRVLGDRDLFGAGVTTMLSALQGNEE